MMHAERIHEIEDLEAELRGVLRVLHEITPNAFAIAQEILNDEFQITLSPQPARQIKSV